MLENGLHELVLGDDPAILIHSKPDHLAVDLHIPQVGIQIGGRGYCTALQSLRSGGIAKNNGGFGTSCPVPLGHAQCDTALSGSLFGHHHARDLNGRDVGGQALAYIVGNGQAVVLYSLNTLGTIAQGDEVPVVVRQVTVRALKADNGNILRSRSNFSGFHTVGSNSNAF